MWPIFVIVMAGAIAILILSDPCIGLRMSYLTNAPQNGRMSIWRMQCEKDGLGCVCRQKANQLRGGPECRWNEDQVERCTKIISGEPARNTK